MIALPNLPHDNLYKFLAFSGLVIIIAINYLYYSLDAEISHRFITNTVEDMQHDDASEATRKSAIDALVYYDENWTKMSPEEKEKWRAETPAIVKQLRDDQSRLYLLNAKKLEEGLIRDRFSKVEILYWIATAAGISLMITGLMLWYTRVQRPQDLLLKKSTGVSDKAEPSF